MKFPTISLIIPTYNSQKTLEELLVSVRNQDYQQEKLEIILADGGSTDTTYDLAIKYGAKMIQVTPKKLQSAEYNRAFGAHRAKGELLAFCDHDNSLPHKHWLKQMVTPFIVHEEVVGVETLRYTYDPKDTILGRYFSLFGVNDVVPFYLGKADRLSYIYDTPSEYGVFGKGRVIKENNYFLVYFNKNHIPTIGSNGFFVHRKLLLSEARSDVHHFFHIDVNVDLIKKGYNCYAFVNDSIVHKTGERGIFDYFRRRKLFMLKYGFEDFPKRRFSVYEKKDFYKLLFFIIISVTFIKPFYDSFRGYLKIRDPAWFLHPIICFWTLAIYSVSIIEYKIKNISL